MTVSFPGSRSIGYGRRMRAWRKSPRLVAGRSNWTCTRLRHSWRGREPIARFTSWRELPQGILREPSNHGLTATQAVEGPAGDALPVLQREDVYGFARRSEEHTSEL